MKEDSFFFHIINSIYLNLSRTVNRLPFSGRFWLEEIFRGVAEETLKKYSDKIEFVSHRPVDICSQFLKLLDCEGFLNAADYYLEQQNEYDVQITVRGKGCVYKTFCTTAREEGLTFNCGRTATLQAILTKILGHEYTSSMETELEKGVCRGILYKSTKVKNEIVTREGHNLKIAGERAVLWPMSTYASILASIKNHAPYILTHVLFDAGYRSGLFLAERAKDIYHTPDEYLQMLFSELTNHGMGKIELVELDLDKNRATIRCHDSFTVECLETYGHLYRTPRAICDLLRGNFSAYLSVLFSKQIICEEMLCKSMGHPYCEFVAIPQESRMSIRGGKI